MKKLMASLVALALALSLTACGSGETPAASSEAPTPSATPSTPVSSQESVAPPSEIPSEPAVESKNLALKGTAIADGERDMDGDGTPDASLRMPHMNDGNEDTLWQSSEKGNETEENPSWFGIVWEEAQTFDTMFVMWEQAHPTENGFRVEISEDGETWTEVEYTAVRGGTPNENITGGLNTDKQTDDITLAEAVTTKYVRIVAFTHYTMPDDAPEAAGNTKSPTGVYEFEIYNSADLEPEEGEGTESTDETVAE